jgi:hypothetical protein
VSVFFLANSDFHIELSQLTSYYAAVLQTPTHELPKARSELEQHVMRHYLLLHS